MNREIGPRLPCGGFYALGCVQLAKEGINCPRGLFAFTTHPEATCVAGPVKGAREIHTAAERMIGHFKALRCDRCGVDFEALPESPTARGVLQGMLMVARLTGMPVLCDRCCPDLPEG